MIGLRNLPPLSTHPELYEDLFCAGTITSKLFLQGNLLADDYGYRWKANCFKYPTGIGYIY